MKVITVEEENEEKALLKLSEELCVPASELRFLQGGNKKFKFEALSCPASVEVQITADKMKAFWTQLFLPIGEKSPKLDLAFLIKCFEKKGILAGLKKDVIEREFIQMISTPGFDESKPFQILIAEGVESTETKTGRPKYLVDPKLLEKTNPIYARKGETIVSMPYAEKGAEGFEVTGAKKLPVVEDQFRIGIGPGIEVVRDADETRYVAKISGRISNEQGIRLKVESKLIDQDGGMEAWVETNEKSFTGQKFTAKDLLELARDHLVSFGFLTENEIESQLRSAKKWPAKILVAKGQLAINGGPGEIKYLFKISKSANALDTLKAKSQIVFPQEELAIVGPSTLPVQGQTVYGETLRGKSYQELPIYPGKNVNKEKRGEDLVFKSAIYGRVRADGDRLHVDNTIQISADKMEAYLELFPQQELAYQDLAVILRERDILFGANRENLERALKYVYTSGRRIDKFIVAKGRASQPGIDAKVVYHFGREEPKAGLFQKKSQKIFFAAPGDLIATKFPIVEAEAGMNVFREEIPINKTQEAKDVPLEVGKFVVEKRFAKGSEKEAPRIELRARAIGIVTFKNGMLDVLPTLTFDKDESLAQIALANRSDFGTPITIEMLTDLAQTEGIRVPIEMAEIQKALRAPRPADGNLYTVPFAKAIPVKNGTEASINYFVEYNGKPIRQALLREGNSEEPATFCDCVRPRELLAIKTPATNGIDGKGIFGKRIAATRGLDELWRILDGVGKTSDGLQLMSTLDGPGFVFVEQKKICVRTTVKVAVGKMSASATVYPSKNPRFQVRSDKVMGMLQAAGVKSGINRIAIEEAIDECFKNEKPVTFEAAHGKMPTQGKGASYVFAVDANEKAGEVRQDGSMDFRNRAVFQNVRKGQLLLVKHPATKGDDGYDVLGNILPGLMGHDAKMSAGEGVERSKNGLEILASRDGIVEFLEKSIRVIPGLFISEDVGFKTGNIEAGGTKVVIRGSVLPDFLVRGDKEIVIEKAAEACQIIGKEDVSVRGGIIGRNKGHVSAGGKLETFYITAGATVEVLGDIHVGSEIMNSRIYTGGMLHCTEGAGTICGGEITAFKGLKARVIGALGSETQTVVRLGEHFAFKRDALKHIEESGLLTKMNDLEDAIRILTKEITEIYDRLPEAAKKDISEAQRLQEDYRARSVHRKEIQTELEVLMKERSAIMDAVPHNKDASVVVTDLIHPGVAIIYKEVVWVLKEPLRGVEIKWNPATSNLISRRI